MTEIQGKLILVRVSARFELSGVDCIIIISQTEVMKCKKDIRLRIWRFIHIAHGRSGGMTYPLSNPFAGMAKDSRKS